MALDIYVRDDYDRKTNSVTAYGDSLGGVPMTYYVQTAGVDVVGEGTQIGSIVINETTGASTTLIDIQFTNYLVLESQIISNSTDIYSVQVSSEYAEDRYSKLDLYDDEPIEVTENIKDFKDVAKVLSDYSQQFKVPASKINNGIFENYYNNDIVDGFDARFRRKCIMKLAGADWKEGAIRLTSVDMENNNAVSYNITFFSTLSSLKTILGDDTLDELEYLDAFNHEVSFSSIKDYLNLGAELDYDVDGYPTGNTTRTTPPGFLAPLPQDFPDMMYPLISAKDRYYVDVSDSQPDISGTRNLYTPTNDQYHALYCYDLKPSIKIIHFIKAMEFKYGIEFSTDFFNEYSTVFQSTYMHCAGESGRIIDKIEETNTDFPLESLSFSTGTETREGVALDYISVGRSGLPTGGRRDLTSYTYEATVDVTGSGAYSVSVIDKDTNVEYFSDDSDGGNYNLSVVVSSSRSLEAVKPVVVITTKGGVTQVELTNVVLTRVFDPVFGATVNTIGNYTTTRDTSLSQGIEFRKELVPRMKCMDFIRSLFKTFNLVAYIENNIIVIKTLDSYYEEGNTHNITRFVDFNSHKISRSDVFSEINYEFKEAKTVFRIKSNELTSDSFGDEKFKSENNSSFDGGSYDVKVDFGKMIYEKFYDVSTNQYVNSRWGYSVGESFSPTIEDNLIHCLKIQPFYVSVNGTDYDYKITDGTSYTKLPFTSFPVFASPRNFFEDGADTVNLNFGDESYNNQDINDNSLFKKYHENYILSIYNKQSRLFSVEAQLPIDKVRDIKLNDKIIINSDTYIINSKKTNYTTGRTSFELLVI